MPNKDVADKAEDAIGDDYRVWDPYLGGSLENSKLVRASDMRSAVKAFCEQEWDGMDAGIYSEGRQVAVLASCGTVPKLFYVELEAVPNFIVKGTP